MPQQIDIQQILQMYAMKDIELTLLKERIVQLEQEKEQSKESKPLKTNPVE